MRASGGTLQSSVPRSEGRDGQSGEGQRPVTGLHRRRAPGRLEEQGEAWVRGAGEAAEGLQRPSRRARRPPGGPALSLRVKQGAGGLALFQKVTSYSADRARDEHGRRKMCWEPLRRTRQTCGSRNRVAEAVAGGVGLGCALFSHTHRLLQLVMNFKYTK